MKKRSIRTGILFALLTPVLLICAENPIYAATTQTAGSATVSYHVDPAYQVTIPVDTSMRFNETETSYGNIVVEQAQIEDGKCIQVSLLSDLNLKNSNNSKVVIPYQILAQDEAGSRPFTSAQYTKAGEETPLTIAIKKEDWKKAAAGEYADTVTFTISYVDKFFMTMSVLAADAGSSSNSQSTIRTTVPDSHNIRVEKNHADIVIEGEEDQIEGNIDNFVVDRFAEPKIRITPEEGWKVSRILLNGEDVTEQFQDGSLTLEEVCEDTTLVIETAEDTSGGESKDPDKDKDPGKNPDKDKDPNKGTPGTGKGHESEKKTPLNKLKNQMAAVTGDEARPMLYALAAIAAAAVISVTVIRRKNK